MWGPDVAARCATEPAKTDHIFSHIRLKSVVTFVPPPKTLSDGQPAAVLELVFVAG
jgi:hypothetical protein